MKGTRVSFIVPENYRYRDREGGGGGGSISVTLPRADGLGFTRFCLQLQVVTKTSRDGHKSRKLNRE